jgi:hypothetical protein
MSHWLKRKLRKVDTMKGWHLKSWLLRRLVGTSFCSSMEGWKELATWCMKRSFSCIQQAVKTVSQMKKNIIKYQLKTTDITTVT